MQNKGGYCPQRETGGRGQCSFEQLDWTDLSLIVLNVVTAVL